LFGKPNHPLSLARDGQAPHTTRPISVIPLTHENFPEKEYCNFFPSHGTHYLVSAHSPFPSLCFWRSNSKPPFSPATSLPIRHRNMTQLNPPPQSFNNTYVVLGFLPKPPPLPPFFFCTTNNRPFHTFVFEALFFCPKRLTARHETPTSLNLLFFLNPPDPHFIPSPSLSSSLSVGISAISDSFQLLSLLSGVLCFIDLPIFHRAGPSSSMLLHLNGIFLQTRPDFKGRSSPHFPLPSLLVCALRSFLVYSPLMYFPPTLG